MERGWERVGCLDRWRGRGGRSGAAVDERELALVSQVGGSAAWRYEELVGRCLASGTSTRTHIIDFRCDTTLFVFLYRASDICFVDAILRQTFIWETARSRTSAPNDTGTVAVLDGSTSVPTSTSYLRMLNYALQLTSSSHPSAHPTHHHQCAPTVLPFNTVLPPHISPSRRPLTHWRCCGVMEGS